MARWSCPVLLIGLLFASCAGSKVAGALVDDPRQWEQRSARSAARTAEAHRVSYLRRLRL